MMDESAVNIVSEADLFAAIFEHCEDAIIGVSLDGVVTSWNRAATKLFGFGADEMIGGHVTRIIPERLHSEERRMLAQIGEGRNVGHLETQRIGKDGNALDISLTVSPIRDRHGNVIGASKIARDITPRKRAESARQKLIECSQLVGRPFLHAVVEALAQALDVRWVLLCDLHPNDPGRARVVAAWSDGRPQAYYEYDLTGTPCANVLGGGKCYFPSNVAELFPQDGLLEKMGAESYYGVPLRNLDGGTLGLLAVLNDKPIDPSRQPEATLELFAGRVASEMQRLATTSVNERLGRIVEDAASETFVFDAHTLRFILVNRGARDNLGYSMDELHDLTPLDIKPTMSAELFSDMLGPLRSREQQVVHFETIHRRKDGTDYNVSVALQLLEDEARPVFYAAIVDTTERDAAVRALMQVSHRLDTVLNNTTMSVLLMDDRQHCVYMNPAAERLTGYSLDETLGRPLHDLIHHTHPDGRPFPLHECEIDRAFPEENQVQGETVFIHKNGSFYPVAFTASPIKDGGGKAIGTVIEVRDITAEIQAREAMTNFNTFLQKRVEEVIGERESVEAQLRQSQKMEAIGKLTGGVAHDFNNLLQVVSGNLQLLMRDVAGNGRAEQRVQNAISGVSRGAKLASQLLAFGRRQPLAPKAVNLGRLVIGMDDLLKRALGEGIEVESIVSDDLWNTFVDETQLENAILNLAINARDAMNGRGRLTIEAENARIDDRYVAQHPDVAPGQYVMIAVSDTGCGIPRENLDQVFEPFFTTKPTGQGTGLGLSMVYGLVKQSNGHIKIYSEVGEGTTIRIYLPWTRRDEVAASVADLGPVRGGTETILVVEDDDDVRTTVVALLTDLGYKVLRARDAASGLAIVDSGVPIDLLFTDVVMPGAMQSHEMAHKAQKKLPGLAVLFTSGYTESSIVHGGRLDAKVELLSKPYLREDLALRLRKCLDARPQSASKAGADDGTHVDAPSVFNILLVEDEILIRMSTADMVSDMGHTVFEAGSVAEALRVLEANPVDIVITDIGLPGDSGLTLVKQVQDRWPAIRIVVASGVSGPDDADQSDLAPGVRWLGKPYDQIAIEKILKR